MKGITIEKHDKIAYSIVGKEEIDMAKNTKGEQSKNKLIKCAAKLFLQNGYNATGINDILTRTGLPKGFFLFSFFKKKDLAISVSTYFEKNIEKWISKAAEGKVWEDFVTDLLEQMIEAAKNNKHFGCPFAVLGLEAAFSQPDMAEYYFKSMKKMIDIFTRVFEFSGISSDRACIIANRAFAMYEGYLVYYRISKDINILKIMQNDSIALYKDYKQAEA